MKDYRPLIKEIEPTDGVEKCPHCIEQIEFAKKHNLRIVVDTFSWDIVGVEYDPKRYKE